MGVTQTLIDVFRCLPSLARVVLQRAVVGSAAGFRQRKRPSRLLSPFSYELVPDGDSTERKLELGKPPWALSVWKSSSSLSLS